MDNEISGFLGILAALEVLERRLVEAILGAAQRQWGFCGRVSTVGEEGDKIRLCRV